jgi:serine/threonine-protein kinase
MSPERWQQVGATFAEAVQREPGQRQAFLAQACADDPELRAEVEALLAHDEEVVRVDFLPPPCPRGSASQALAADGAGPNLEQSILGRYEILGELGRGGMGVVYKARQLKLNRLVALKMIRAGARAGSQDLARFRREARAVACQEHPHIVHIYEYGDQEGQPWFSMELVNGGTLAEKVNGAPQPPRESAELVQTLARAVQHAHDRGVFHRDLKPANVLLTAHGQPKISDFGLARMLQGDTASLSTPEGTLGTPSYMPPEQALGGDREVGPAIDVYALGAILYELLTGRPPFRGHSPLSTLQQVVSAEPVAPRQLQPNLPLDLNTICLKCLAKEPPKRYASALALAEDLRRFLAGEPIRARPTGPLERLWRWSRRNRLVAGLAGALAVMTAAALVLVTWQWLRAEANARTAEANFAQAEKNFDQARMALSDFGLAVQEDLRSRSGMQATRKKLLDQLLKHYLSLLEQRGHDLNLLYSFAYAYHHLGITHCEIGRLNDAKAAHLKAASLWHKVHRESIQDINCRALLAANDMYLGWVENLTGEWKDALRSLQQALDQFEDLAQQNSHRKDWDRRNVALCYSVVGDIYVESGRLDEADRWYRKARVIQEQFVKERRLPQARPNHTDSMYRLAKTDDATGWMHYLGGRSDQALPFLTQARDRRKQLVDTDPSHIWKRGHLARTDLHLAVVYHALRQRDEARSALQQASTAIEPLVRENPEVTDFQRTLAEVHLQRGKLDHEEGRHAEALRSFEQARQISENLLRDNPAVTQTRVILAESFTGISHVRQAQGQPAGALQALHEAQAAWQKLASDHPDIPRFQSGLADVRSELARLNR